MKTLSSTKLPRSEFGGGQTTEQRHSPPMLKDFLKGGHNSMKRRQSHGNSNELLTTIRHRVVTDSTGNEKIQKESVLVSCKPASSTLSALHKVSAAIIKLLPLSILSPSRRNHTTNITTNIKFGVFLRKEASSMESNKGIISQSFLLTMGSLSPGDIGSGDEMKVRVRDIMKRKSFEDEEEASCENCYDSLSPPQKESNGADGTSNSWPSSPMRSCKWSMNGCSLNLQSSRGGSVCSVQTCGVKNTNPLPNYRSNKREGMEEMKDDSTKDASWASDDTNKVIESLATNHLEISGTETDRQEVEEGLNDGCTICSNVEAYEEKVQFSPVSVLDFQFEDRDEVPASPMGEILPSTERKLPQKTRHRENLAECNPMKLAGRFSSSDYEPGDEDFRCRKDSQIDGDYLNSELGNADSIKDIVMKYLGAAEKRRWASFELLVIDGFREGWSFDTELEEEDLMRVTATRVLDWVERETEPDEPKISCLKEMGRNCDWRTFKMGEEEMAAEMEAGILWSLMDDLIIDIMN